MENNKSNFIKTGLKIVFCVFLISLTSSCASVNSSSTGNTSSAGTALSFVQPLIIEGTCGEGKGIYRKVKNTHSIKEIVVTIETDMSPDPNNWYPSKRDFSLQPNQLRILGCSIVDEGAGKEDSQVSHAIIDARFK